MRFPHPSHLICNDVMEGEKTFVLLTEMNSYESIVDEKFQVGDINQKVDLLKIFQISLISNSIG